MEDAVQAREQKACHRLLDTEVRGTSACTRAPPGIVPMSNKLYCLVPCPMDSTRIA
jgi:hypothetical protein